MRDVMTADHPKDHDPATSQHSPPGGAVGPARRQAIAAMVAEDFDAFAHTRRDAQRKLVHALENCATAADIRRWHFNFVSQAAHHYAERARRFDALLDKLAFDPSSEL